MKETEQDKASAGESKSVRKKRNRSLRRVVGISFLFAIWIFLAEYNTTLSGTGPFTNLNIGYILTDFLNFIANTLKVVIINIGDLVNAVNANPLNLKYLAGTFASLGIIPLYLITRKGTDSSPTATFVSLLYLFYSMLIIPSWFTFLYLGVFPTLFLYGVASYIYGRRFISLLFFFATIFVVPVSAVAVFIFSILAFYRSWDNGNEAFLKNTSHIFLESVSGFVFIVFFLKYSYKFFLYPSLVRASDSSNLMVVNAPQSFHYLSAVFANVMPLVPEFTSYGNLIMSVIVIIVVGAMAAITRITIKRVGNNNSGS